MRKSETDGARRLLLHLTSSRSGWYSCTTTMLITERTSSTTGWSFSYGADDDEEDYSLQSTSASTSRSTSAARHGKCVELHDGNKTGTVVVAQVQQRGESTRLDPPTNERPYLDSKTSTAQVIGRMDTISTARDAQRAKEWSWDDGSSSTSSNTRLSSPSGGSFVLRFSADTLRLGLTVSLSERLRRAQLARPATPSNPTPRRFIPLRPSYRPSALPSSLPPLTSPNVPIARDPSLNPFQHSSKRSPPPSRPILNVHSLLYSLSPPLNSRLVTISMKEEAERAARQVLTPDWLERELYGPKRGAGMMIEDDQDGKQVKMRRRKGGGRGRG
jgi:hypothetical protein